SHSRTSLAPPTTRSRAVRPRRRRCHKHRSRTSGLVALQRLDGDEGLGAILDRNKFTTAESRVQRIVAYTEDFLGFQPRDHIGQRRKRIEDFFRHRIAPVRAMARLERPWGSVAYALSLLPAQTGPLELV